METGTKSDIECTNTSGTLNYSTGSTGDSISGVTSWTWYAPYPCGVKKDRGLEPQKIIFNKQTTVVIWNDGTKTKSTCQSADAWDEQVGFAMCLLKKMYGKKVYGKRLYKRMLARATRQTV